MWKKSQARTPVQKFAVLPITGSRQISAHQYLAYDATGAESPLLGEELPTGRVPAPCPMPVRVFLSDGELVSGYLVSI